MWKESTGIDNTEQNDKNVIFPIISSRNKSEKTSSIIIVQCIICAIIIIICFALSRLNETSKTDMQNYMNYIVNNGVSLSSEDEIARLALSFTDNIKKVLSNNNENSTANSQAADSESQSNTLYDILQQDNNGQGGQFYIAQLQAKNKTAPQGTTFSQYVLSETPCLPVENSILTSGYGYRQNPITNEDDFHTGVDLAAALNTGIHSAFSGTVTKTGYDSIRGNYIFIKHSKSVITQYSHLNYIFVCEGELVSKGDIIGCVGSTGLSTGPHLHFEIKINGIYVNPRPALPLPVYDKL